MGKTICIGIGWGDPILGNIQRWYLTWIASRVQIVKSSRRREVLCRIDPVCVRDNSRGCESFWLIISHSAHPSLSSPNNLMGEGMPWSGYHGVVATCYTSGTGALGEGPLQRSTAKSTCTFISGLPQESSLCAKHHG